MKSKAYPLAKLPRPLFSSSRQSTLFVSHPPHGLSYPRQSTLSVSPPNGKAALLPSLSYVTGSQ